MTKYVISGYIGFDNFGDEAIASVLIEHLKASKAEKITVISLNPEKTSRLYGVDSVRFLDFIRPILKSDVLISGGGSLLQDVTSLKSLLYYLSVIMTAMVLGKKVFIFAQGFTPFRTNFGKFLTEFVLRYCDRISVRDIKSQEYLNNLNISSELVPDPVFLIKTPENINKNGLGVQLRSFKNLNEDFLENLANEVSYKLNSGKIKLFSMHDTQDLPVLENFAQKLTKRGCAVEILKDLTVADATEELSKLEYLISMRFHPCLVAAKAGVKVLGINYDIKVQNLGNDLGFPVINMSSCEVKDGIDKLLNINTQNYKLPEIKFADVVV